MGEGVTLPQDLAASANDRQQIFRPSRVEATRVTESQQHAWSSLHVLWEERKRDGDLPEGEIAKIDAIFTATDEAGTRRRYGWERFNDAELRIGGLLSPSQTRAQYLILLTSAARRSLPAFEEFERNRTLFDQPDKALEQHAAYMSLLYALQNDFIEKRLLRGLRAAVAERLFRYGMAATLMPILVQILYAIYATVIATSSGQASSRGIPDESIAALALAASMGMLGAYFSRMISFQTTIANLTFENATNEYLGRVLRLRMLYGMIGALFFFFILKAEIISSSILPNFNILSHDTPVQGRRFTDFLVPSANLAKVMILTFIAGFSERLVPDTLSRIEQQSFFNSR
jgi:hypothetical protein